jgi:hypothetical protein
MECRRAAKPSDEEEIFGAPIRGSEKRGRAFLKTGGPNEGHRRGDAGGRVLPKEHARVIFVTELQLSPSSIDRKFLSKIRVSCYLRTVGKRYSA